MRFRVTMTATYDLKATPEEWEVETDEELVEKVREWYTEDGVEPGEFAIEADEVVFQVEQRS